MLRGSLAALVLTCAMLFTIEDALSSGRVLDVDSFLKDRIQDKIGIRPHSLSYNLKVGDPIVDREKIIIPEGREFVETENAINCSTIPSKRVLVVNSSVNTGRSLQVSNGVKSSFTNTINLNLKPLESAGVQFSGGSNFSFDSSVTEIQREDVVETRTETVERTLTPMTILTVSIKRVARRESVYFKIPITVAGEAKFTKYKVENRCSSFEVAGICMGSSFPVPIPYDEIIRIEDILSDGKYNELLLDGIFESISSNDVEVSYRSRELTIESPECASVWRN